MFSESVRKLLEKLWLSLFFNSIRTKLTKDQDYFWLRFHNPLIPRIYSSWLSFEVLLIVSMCTDDWNEINTDVTMNLSLVQWNPWCCTNTERFSNRDGIFEANISNQTLISIGFYSYIYIQDVSWHP